MRKSYAPRQISDWDQEFLHKYNEAKKNAQYWHGNGEYNWARQWTQYAGDMLNMAGGTYRFKNPPRRPKCDATNQLCTAFSRPIQLQGIKH